MLNPASIMNANRTSAATNPTSVNAANEGPYTSRNGMT